MNSPRTIKLKLTVHGGVRVAAFLQQIEDELVSINLYNIITPERTYKDMTLDKVDYPRDSHSVDLITVSLAFMEIIQVASLSVQAKIIPAPKKPASKDEGEKKPVDVKPAHKPVVPWVAPAHHF